MLKDLIRTIHKKRDEELDLPSMIDIYILSKGEDDYGSFGWHPSELSKFCPRERILREQENLPRKDIPEPRMRRLWDLGHDVHNRYQNYYLGPMGILWGLWECNRCKNRLWGFMPRPRDCSCSFRVKRWIYKEVPVYKEEKGLEEPYKGKSDGILKINNVWYVLDIKTSRSELYGYTSKPHEGYKSQVDIYGKLIRDGCIKSKFIKELPVEKGILLYYNKNDSSHKSYIFDLDFDNAQKYMDLAKVYESAKKENVLPKRLEQCRIKSDYRTKKCRMRDRCFEEEG